MTTLIGLDVSNRVVLVAGGGPVAARRAVGLAAEGALVHVVAPALCEDLIELVAQGRVRWSDREVAEGDLDDAWLVHAATDDHDANAALCRWAQDRRIWSVCASRADSGTARTPSTTEHCGLVVGVVSRSASDPVRARRVRNALADTLRSGRVDLRRHRPNGAVGRVALIGGGPGDAELMTIRALRLVAEADVVVADRLGPRSVLAELPSDVEVIDVGKVPGRHAVTQDEINDVLVQQAKLGRFVVRLKGGDPFLFGRGGEEVAALAAHGIPVEVVPGVTSALSAPLAAGIPVTHRGTSSAVHVVHGHGDLDSVALDAVVRGRATLVILMGVATLHRHVKQLREAGACESTPVAVVEDATLPTQRVTRAPLGEVVTVAEAGAVRAPAVVVVGAVAAPALLEGVR